MQLNILLLQYFRTKISSALIANLETELEESSKMILSAIWTKISGLYTLRPLQNRRRPNLFGKTIRLTNIEVCTNILTNLKKFINSGIT